ncbi:hypothetical protein NDK43_29555 [Neobacillus pocheonensis]|uniref:Uncharacterized protein n=1 Tax=Neobacillus pocheonensis TaxID=363869 RepID=A0ABT0WJ37_9BACI|nr:hypothetical protein [Neobacillus pocheonensis]
MTKKVNKGSRNQNSPQPGMLMLNLPMSLLVATTVKEINTIEPRKVKSKTTSGG